VVVSGSGGTVTVDGQPVNAGLSNFVYGSMAEVTLQALPAPGYRFVSWSGTEFNSTENPATVYMTCNIAVQAIFTPITPLLTIVTHGSGDISPAPGQHYYPQGTVVDLKATPAKGWKFTHWTPNVTNPDAAETSLTLNSDAQVVASFSRVWTAGMISGVIGAAMLASAFIIAIAWLIYRQRKKLKVWMLTVLRSSYTSLVFRLILGGIFIFAGFAKIHTISALISEIDQYKILPPVLGSLYGHVLPYLEIITGILLVLGIVPRITAGIASLMLISFTASKITALAMRLNIQTCNCFGLARPLLSNQSLALDILMMLLAAQIIVFRSELLSIPWPGKR
jgi:uncharacterized membrane protein YphA (DoxX/SURF4 family)